MTGASGAVDVSALAADPDHTAIITDFDGTLAPIVDDPAAARPVDGAAQLLHDLNRRFARVAVVSGRPVEFLAAHLGNEDVVLSGLYGLERMERGHVMIHPAALRWMDAVEDMAARAEADAPESVRIERKGLSFTIHAREAPQHLGWARSMAETLAHASGLALHAGRMSYELRPPVAVDKGTVVTELVEGLGAAVFLGDDVGDLAAFDALDRLRADCGAATLKVGVRSAEAPLELIERADVLVDTPAEAVEILRALLAAVPARDG
jgi:trehalose 6-phosphate phosphatase